MKYAVAPYEEGGKVVVRARADDQQLLLEVQDSGPGMADTGQSDGSGIGIRNTLDRLENLYGDSFRFETINRSAGGLIVRISIPLRYAVPSPSSEVA